MELTIHRGTHQIGGCVTELRTATTRIFIDFGSELPDADDNEPGPSLNIPGLTEPGLSCDGVFFTHTHGDHIGEINRLLPNVPLYLGEASRKISLTLNDRLDTVMDRKATIAALQRARTYEPGKAIAVGDMQITPLCVDHSAFDAYMLLIEADGVKLLHTGDFRDHGYRGDLLIPVLENHVGTVDYLICEGTMLSRDGERVMSEKELSGIAKQIMQENKNVFVLCSSTNIDRIAAFYRAKPDRRPRLCDKYQEDILKIAEKNCKVRSEIYRFTGMYVYSETNQKLINWMNNEGFLMFVRVNDKFREIMEPYRGNCKVIYSMWGGYLQGNTKNQRIVDFLSGFDIEKLHTSGHASADALREVYDTVRPRRGVIPIHGEVPERFKTLLPDANVLLLQDGEVLPL